MFIKVVMSIPGHPFEIPNWYTRQSSLFSNTEPSFLRGFQNKLMTDAVLAGHSKFPDLPKLTANTSMWVIYKTQVKNLHSCKLFVRLTQPTVMPLINVPFYLNAVCTFCLAKKYTKWNVHLHKAVSKAASYARLHRWKVTTQSLSLP